MFHSIIFSILFHLWMKTIVSMLWSECRQLASVEPSVRPGNIGNMTLEQILSAFIFILKLELSNTIVIERLIIPWTRKVWNMLIYFRTWTLEKTNSWTASFPGGYDTLVTSSVVVAWEEQCWFLEGGTGDHRDGGGLRTVKTPWGWDWLLVESFRLVMVRASLHMGPATWSSNFTLKQLL